MIKVENGVFLLDDIDVFTQYDTSIMIKAITKSGDPVELNSEAAIELAELLLKLAKKIE
jgi:hypothetical protein